MIALAAVVGLLTAGGVAVGISTASAHDDPGAEHADAGGPFVSDFIDIRKADRAPDEPRARRGGRGSAGSFVAQCGRNENGHNNPDNFIVAPGVANGAHHLHDYVGNLSADGFSTDESLAAAGTTCRFNDKSTYFWPVLRVRDEKITAEKPGEGEEAHVEAEAEVAAAEAQQDAPPAAAPEVVAEQENAQPAPARPDTGDAVAPQAAQEEAAQAEIAREAVQPDPAQPVAPPAVTAEEEAEQRQRAAEYEESGEDEADGNVGTVLRPRSVRLQFRGNARADVVAMPRFLRLITGDAKAATNGTANARARWSCTGFERKATTQYPLCPRGSRVLRILDFPSCWDGKNTDSANHRTHVVFPQADGSCAGGTKAIPQLRMVLSYKVPPGASYALDSFPEQLHAPNTDHADFANVMSDRLMRQVVQCVNRDRSC
jgi:hypothetical protein